MFNSYDVCFPEKESWKIRHCSKTEKGPALTLDFGENSYFLYLLGDSRALRGAICHTASADTNSRLVHCIYQISADIGRAGTACLSFAMLGNMSKKSRRFSDYTGGSATCSVGAAGGADVMACAAVVAACSRMGDVEHKHTQRNISCSSNSSQNIVILHVSVRRDKKRDERGLLKLLDTFLYNVFTPNVFLKRCNIWVTHFVSIF